MTFLRFRCALRSMLAAAFVVISATSAFAAITPQSDVLLPWFEIDLQRQEAGLTTTFTIVNASPNAVQTMVTVYTNWGIPVLEVPIAFGRTEAKSISLSDWIARGVLPERTLTAGELATLQAALTGKASPVDGLYYGTPFQEGLAVGYVIVQSLGDRPDSLWGDTYSVDVARNSFEAETLTALTHGLQADCKRHGVRFVNRDTLYGATELIIWSGRRFQPSPTPTPVGAKMKITIAVYDQNGNRVYDCNRELMAVEAIQVCHLDNTPSIGWLDVATEDPSYILEHLHSTTQASAELHSYCFAENIKLAGPQIAIEERIAGDDADSAPGPKYSVGDPVAFEMVVTNTGTVDLNPVRVTDDMDLDVTCPKNALIAGESMTCTATAPALACVNVNIATATGTTSSGEAVVSSDLAYYEGIYQPSVTIEALVNDLEADTPTGPLVDAGQPLRWSFIVTNNGNAPLSDITVTRTMGDPAICPARELAPGETMTCTADSLAEVGQQHEIATVSGVDPCLKKAQATDPAYYFGQRNSPSIEIRKYAGENDADEAPGPTIPVGTTIAWRFVVTNNGNVPLVDVVVTDDHGLTPVCPTSALDPGESMTCTASSAAMPCAQANNATVTGTMAGSDPPRTVSAQNGAHYFGQGHPAVTLELSVNGDPADEPPGPWIDENGDVLLTYLVTNTGDVELTSIVVYDERDRMATCPKTALQPGESMTCTMNMLAVAGTQEMLGSVQGHPPCGEPIVADDPAYYRGRVLTAALDLMKTTNGVHATAPPGPEVEMGSPVQWTYLVSNTGMVALSDVRVTDSDGAAVTCPKTTLEPSESMTCTASGIAQPCQYSNTATATGHPAAGENVAAVDDSFYFGRHHATITLDKRTNGEDSPQPPGQPITTGSTVQWTFMVTNTGDVALTGIAVTDDRTATVNCPKTALEPGEAMTCVVSGLALAGQQTNTATVTGTPPCGDAVTSSDVSYYVGVTPAVSLEKLINGNEADDSAHAVTLLSGASILWTFVVTNTGDTSLHDVAVSDDTISTITCPKTALAPGESMTCTAFGVASAGLHCNLGTVTATSTEGTVVTSTDTACYLGRIAAVSIEKRTNGVDADAPPGPEILDGASVTWTYIVTNIGETQLTSVMVTDDRGVAVSCPKTILEPGESMTCTGSGTAVLGQYSNTGTVSGVPAGGDPISASDLSHYLGVGKL